jgi:peptidoglycan hydrolase CwlO-like protein
MKPKNSKERRNSFLKFLALFVVTVGMIVTAVFFTYSVPKKENAQLREVTKVMETGMVFQKDFYDEMKAVKNMIDSLDVPGQNTDYLNSQIGEKMAKLENTIPTKDETHLYDMHTSILRLYSELQISKNKLHELRDAEERIEEYEEAYEDCKDELKQALRELRLK